MSYVLFIRFFPVLLCLMLLMRLAKAQIISPTSTDSLLKKLQTVKQDTQQVNLLLELSHLYIFRKDELTSDLDTALLFSRQAQVLSRSLGYARGEGLSYLAMAQAFHEKKELEKGRQYIQQAITLLEKHGTFADQADAYIELATYYPVSGEGLVEENRLYEKIVNLLEKSGNNLKLAGALSYRGDLYQVQGNNEQALKDLSRALELYKVVKYPRLHQVYDLLGFVSSKTGDYAVGIKYGLAAMKTAEALKDTFLLGNIYQRLGIMYKELGEPQKSFLYFNKCLNIAQKQFYKSTTILLANTISYIIEDMDLVVKHMRTAQVSKVKASIAHLQDIIILRPDTKKDFDCRLAVGRCYINFTESY